MKSPITQSDGKFNVPCSTKIDTSLIVGASIFGLGWGIGGLCPGKLSKWQALYISYTCIHPNVYFPIWTACVLYFSLLRSCNIHCCKWSAPNIISVVAILHIRISSKYKDKTDHIIGMNCWFQTGENNMFH